MRTLDLARVKWLAPGVEFFVCAVARQGRGGADFVRRRLKYFAKRGTER
jgi:hypothetical protein